MIVVTGNDIMRYHRQLLLIRPEAEASPDLRTILTELRIHRSIRSAARVAIETRVGFAIYTPETRTFFTVVAFVIEPARRHGFGKKLVTEALNVPFIRGRREFAAGALRVSRGSIEADEFWDAMEIETQQHLPCAFAVERRRREADEYFQRTRRTS